ncbi:hypothetical protein DFH08DRAFT_786576 [Mycena albidolilacea]|uniref:DUF2470 domain-containing protein n=1 Tax=Mycena albidolilacea TaxID=1033008 RepID=A0AAD6ZMH1_9AGAR|nr:hypothetical protein DFH08DRAFT_786576 [Mycena albidolilacea]
MADPVAEKSAFLKMYMSSHPDTLVAYAKWYGKVAEPITSAEMSAINTKSMTLTCTLKNATRKVVVVAINPPLKGYDDVKPRLLEMKALSQEGLGMIKSPQITSFQFPKDGLWVAMALFSVIPYGAFAPSASGSSSPFLVPAQFLHSYASQNAFMYAWWILITTHVLEASYAVSLCVRHRAPLRVSVAYFFTTLLFGLPGWSSLRKRIQQARIDSVMKIE